MHFPVREKIMSFPARPSILPSLKPHFPFSPRETQNSRGANEKEWRKRSRGTGRNTEETSSCRVDITEGADIEDGDEDEEEVSWREREQCHPRRQLLYLCLSPVPPKKERLPPQFEPALSQKSAIRGTYALMECTMGRWWTLRSPS